MSNFLGSLHHCPLDFVEEGETVAAEVGPVVIHLQSVANSVPNFAVKAVGEGGLIGAVLEVGINQIPVPLISWVISCRCREIYISLPHITIKSTLMTHAGHRAYKKVDQRNRILC